MNIVPFVYLLITNYNNSLSELVDCIESIIKANEEYHRRKCEKFTLERVPYMSRVDNSLTLTIKTHGIPS